MENQTSVVHSKKRKRTLNASPSETTPITCRKCRRRKNYDTNITSLPVEVIELICSWLLYRDDILNFRLANKTLTEKSSRFFAITFFECNSFTLANLRSGLEILRQLQASYFAGYIRDIAISPGDINIPRLAHGFDYNDIFRAKNMDPRRFVKELSYFPKLRAIRLLGLCGEINHSVWPNSVFRDAVCRFVQIMAEDLNAPGLKLLTFEYIELTAHDITTLVNRHNKTLQSVHLDCVLLCSGLWPSVISAVRRLEGLSHLRIENPGERDGGKTFDVSFSPKNYDSHSLHDMVDDIDSDDSAFLSHSDEWADENYNRSWSCKSLQDMKRFLNDITDRYRRSDVSVRDYMFID